jgi:4,5:9,10-diseco-3-hydroxy-5,9,17-trioxoandrosta-1(10),2-diene-4-oate hydrolase
MRLELGAPAGSAMADAGGVRIAVARWGAGAPVICLHAIGHGARDFEALAARIGERFEVIALDWPGHGRSDDDVRAPASAQRYAELLVSVLAKLGVTNPIILGNSIGGAAAMIHAARAPVRGLVLCDSGGLVEVDAEVRRLIGLFVRFFRAGVRGAWWFRPLFALYRLVLPAPAAREQRRRIVAAASASAPVLVQAWSSFARPEADLRALAARLDVPAWFAWAKGDKVIPLARCRPAIAAMRQASLTEFAGGHAAFLEQPEAFVAGFEAFVASLPADPPVNVAG